MVDYQLQHITQFYLTVIPAVNLDTATALEEGPDVSIRGRLAPQLVSLQVGIVGGVNEVVRERLSHVLVHCLMFWINCSIVLAAKKAAYQLKKVVGVKSENCYSR